MVQPVNIRSNRLELYRKACYQKQADCDFYGSLYYFLLFNGLHHTLIV